MAKWYYSVGDRAQGPVEKSVVIELLQKGQLTLVDLVYCEGDEAWQTVSEVADFKAALTPVVPPVVESGPYKFNPAISVTWVLLQKKSDGEGEHYEQSGPFSYEQLETMLNIRTASYTDYVWRPGYPRWARLGHLPEFDRRKKPRDGDMTPELIPIPRVQLELPEGSHELLRSVVQAKPAKANKPSNEREAAPAEARGSDLTEETASQFNLSGVVQTTPVSISEIEASPPPLDHTPVPQIPDAAPESVTKSQFKLKQTDPRIRAMAAAADSDATVVQKPTVRPTTATGIKPPPMDENATVVQSLPKESEIFVEEIPTVAWKKPLVIAACAFGLLLIGGSALKYTGRLDSILESPRLQAVFGKHHASDADEAADMKHEAGAPARPHTRKEAAAPQQRPAHEESSFEAVEPATKSNGSAAQAAVSPSPEIKIPFKQMAPGSQANVLEIVAIRTEPAHPQFALNTDAPVGSTVWLTLSAKSGEVIRVASYNRSTSAMRAPGQIPTFDLTNWNLPQGQYRVDAVAGDIRVTKSVFIGKRDAAYSGELGRHLKTLAFQQQSEKKALFQNVKQMESLAKALGDNYFKYRRDPRSWRIFYTTWKRQVQKSRTGAIWKSAIENRNQYAYPDEIIALRSMAERLGDQAGTLNDSIMSGTPARDVANTSNLAIVKEFNKLRNQVAQISSRK